ncbi:MAG: type II toxin-antitoxin system RelE/ParE family toxin [Bacteroidota bacterium]
MSFELLISDEASLDIADSYLWYEMQREGLGKDFELCIEAGLNRIVRNPKNFQKKYKSVRIHFIERFPYGIHYLLDRQLIKVIAVFHTARDPKSWNERMK